MRPRVLKEFKNENGSSSKDWIIENASPAGKNVKADLEAQLVEAERRGRSDWGSRLPAPLPPVIVVPVTEQSSS